MGNPHWDHAQGQWGQHGSQPGRGVGKGFRKGNRSPEPQDRAPPESPKQLLSGTQGFWHHAQCQSRLRPGGQTTNSQRSTAALDWLPASGGQGIASTRCGGTQTAFYRQRPQRLRASQKAKQLSGSKRSFLFEGTWRRAKISKVTKPIQRGMIGKLTSVRDIGPKIPCGIDNSEHGRTQFMAASLVSGPGEAFLRIQTDIKQCGKLVDCIARLLHGRRGL